MNRLKFYHIKNNNKRKEKKKELKVGRLIAKMSKTQSPKKLFYLPKSKAKSFQIEIMNPTAPLFHVFKWSGFFFFFFNKLTEWIVLSFLGHFCVQDKNERYKGKMD